MRGVHKLAKGIYILARWYRPRLHMLQPRAEARGPYRSLREARSWLITYRNSPCVTGIVKVTS